MEINHPEVVAEVTAALARYEQALVTNDIPVLNELFWVSPHTIRYGPAELLYGHDEISRYRGARPAAGLERTVDRQVVTTFGRDAATASVQFTRGGRIGRQMQTWVRMPEGWRVVAAHVSMLAT